VLVAGGDHDPADDEHRHTPLLATPCRLVRLLWVVAVSVLAGSVEDTTTCERLTIAHPRPEEGS